VGDQTVARSLQSKEITREGGQTETEENNLKTSGIANLRSGLRIDDGTSRK
jgi:hypothetical protein